MDRTQSMAKPTQWTRSEEIISRRLEAELQEERNSAKFDNLVINFGKTGYLLLVLCEISPEWRHPQRICEGVRSAPTLRGFTKAVSTVLAKASKVEVIRGVYALSRLRGELIIVVHCYLNEAPESRRWPSTLYTGALKVQYAVSVLTSYSECLKLTMRLRCPHSVPAPKRSDKLLPVFLSYDAMLPRLDGKDPMEPVYCTALRFDGFA